MRLHDASYVGCTAVADFHSFSVEEFVEWMMRWEVSVNDVQEFFADVGF